MIIIYEIIDLVLNLLCQIIIHSGAILSLKRILNNLDKAIGACERALSCILRHGLENALRFTYEIRDLYESAHREQKRPATFTYQTTARMAFTSGERAALWRKRQREDPLKHEKYKRKKERYKMKKVGVVKSVAQMSVREHRKTKRNWRHNQRNKREKDRSILKAVENTLSPPTSPTHAIPELQENTIKTRGRKT